jgi:membrane-associated protein
MEFMTDFINLLADQQELIQYGGLALILTVIYIETAFFLGLVAPGGDSFLLTIGLLAGDGFFHYPLPVLLLLIIAAAIMGDFTGYYQGKFLGNRLFAKEETLLFKKSYLEKTRAVADRFGIWAFIIARFIPTVRTLMPLFAGASKVPIRIYAAYNMIGGTVWVTLLVSTGFYFGRKYPFIIDYSMYIFLGVILFVTTPLVIYAIRSYIHNKKQRKINIHEENNPVPGGADATDQQLHP